MTKPSSEVVFQDPPRKSTGAYDWAKIADKLRSQPNQWALIFTNDKHSRAVSVKQGSVRSITPLTKDKPDDGFEFETRNNHNAPDEKGKVVRYCDLYGRYVPPKSRRRSN